MEEILASIRRIISEDETPAGDGAAAVAEAAPALPEPEPEPEPAAAAPAAAPAPEPEPEPAPVIARAPEPVLVAVPEEDDDDDDLELTQKVETHGDLDVLAPPEPEPPPPPQALESLVSERVAVAAAASFGQLTANILMPRSDRTLEDVVRELLKPLLQQWLDENLGAIVQDAVQTEVERIARGRIR